MGGRHAARTCHATMHSNFSFLKIKFFSFLFKVCDSASTRQTASPHLCRACLLKKERKISTQPPAGPPATIQTRVQESPPGPVPHEVLPTLAGERLALAGWLHEESQEWFGEEA